MKKLDLFLQLCSEYPIQGSYFVTFLQIIDPTQSNSASNMVNMWRSESEMLIGRYNPLKTLVPVFKKI